MSSMNRNDDAVYAHSNLWQHQWNSAHSLWNATWTDIYDGAEEQYDRPWLLVSYTIWDDLGWLPAEAVELAGPASLSIENLRGQAQVGWTLIGLCQKHVLKHDWGVKNNAWAVVPTGALWVCGSHGWL